MFVEDIIAACKRVIDGDHDALEELGLDAIQYRNPAPFNTHPLFLQSAYNQTLHLAVAARELDLATLQMQTHMTLMLVKAAAEHNNITIEHRIDGADVAEVMLSLVEEETTRLRAIPGNANTEDSSDADEERNSSSSVLVQPVHASPTTQPTSQPSGATPEPSAATTYSKQSSTVPPISTVSPTPTTCTSTRPSLSTTTTSSLPVKSPYVKATSKNKRRHCSLCPYFGTHLQRYLDQKHAGSFNTNREKMKLFHVKDKLSGSKTMRRFQCTYKSCGAIITRLGQHLTRTHQITNAKLLAQVKAACIRIPSSSSPSTAPPKRQPKTAPPAKPRPDSPASTSSESEGESFVSGGSITDEHVEVDHHQLQVEADLDEISTFADTDTDEEDVRDTIDNTWHAVDTSKSTSQNVREYFMSRFYRYLVHVEGGAHSQQQALIHARQVHNILSPKGGVLTKDLSIMVSECFVWLRQESGTSIGSLKRTEQLW